MYRWEECSNIVSLLDKKVNVTGFDPCMQDNVKDLDLVSAALTYGDCPVTGEVIILMIHQAVHIPMMENDLLCLMQI